MLKCVLVGILIGWLILSIVYWLADVVFDNIEALRWCYFIPYLIAYLFVEFIPNCLDTIPLIPMCVEYKINFFRTNLIDIAHKLDSEEKREKWLAKIRGERNKKAWKRLFREIPISKECYSKAELEEIREKLNKKVEEF